MFLMILGYNYNVHKLSFVHRRPFNLFHEAQIWTQEYIVCALFIPMNSNEADGNFMIKVISVHGFPVSYYRWVCNEQRLCTLGH